MTFEFSDELPCAGNIDFRWGVRLERRAEQSGRAALPALMKRARKIAEAGGCLGFTDVVRALGDDGLTLRLYASARERQLTGIASTLPAGKRAISCFRSVKQLRPPRSRPEVT